MSRNEGKMTRIVLRLCASLLHIKSKDVHTFSRLSWLRTSLYSTLIPHQIGGKILTSSSISSFKETRRNYVLRINTGPTLGTITQNRGETNKVFAKICRCMSSPVNSEENDDLTLHQHASSHDHDLDGNSRIRPLQSEMEIFDPDKTDCLPEMSRTVYNLAPYVYKSETLQNLVKLGVSLSKIEKVKGIASMLLMSDFDRDILPYLHHLVRVGVAPEKLGHILSVNPMILTEHLEHLVQRVGYMISKDFTMEDVASMYSRAPVMILMDPVGLDNKLTYLQRAFGLSDQEVRQVVLTFPKILPWRKEKINDVRVTLKEFMGFENRDLKLLLLREPKLFTANKHKVWKTFDFLHNTMLVPHSLLVKRPSCLRSRLNKLKGRHYFLVHVGRAQYDPCKENYVSMGALVECTDDVFCINVAKSTEIEFQAFLKTL